MKTAENKCFGQLSGARSIRELVKIHNSYLLSYPKLLPLKRESEEIKYFLTKQYAVLVNTKLDISVKGIHKLHNANLPPI